MKSSLLGPFFTLLFLLSNVYVFASVVRKDYHYTHNPSSWQQARNNCRSADYLDLALITQGLDFDLLHINKYMAWIGLYRQKGGLWTWSDGSRHYFRNWDEYITNQHDCVGLYSATKRFHLHRCSKRLFFYCDTDNGITFVRWAMTWSDAQNHCRRYYKDLATIDSWKTLLLVPIDVLYYVWIGLRRTESGEDWEWGTGQSEYANWALQQPSTTGNCVAISSEDKRMSSLDCETLLPYVCYRNNLVLVKENKTWEEALAHCRAIENSPSQYNNHLYDLVSLASDLDQVYMWSWIKEATTDEVWTGLRFFAQEWLWVDGATMTYQNLPLCPTPGQYCGTLSRDNSTSRDLRNCTEKRNFLCYRKQ